MIRDPETGKMTTRTCGNIREEFRVPRFGFGDSYPRNFVTAQFLRPQFFCAWTLLWAIFHLLVTTLQFYFIDDHPNPKWLSFLTNWGYILLVLFSVVDCAITFYVNISKKALLENDECEIPWYMKIQWVLFNVSTVTAVVITLLFYTLLTPDMDANSILKHAINSVYALSNLIISAKTVRILHVYQAVLLSVLYAVFSAIFQEAGGGTIYEILDWNKMPNTVLLTLATALIVVPLIHLFCFTIYSIRVFASNSCHQTKTVSDVKSTGTTLRNRDVDKTDVGIPNISKDI